MQKDGVSIDFSKMAVGDSIKLPVTPLVDNHGFKHHCILINSMRYYLPLNYKPGASVKATVGVLGRYFAIQCGTGVAMYSTRKANDKHYFEDSCVSSIFKQCFVIKSNSNDSYYLFFGKFRVYELKNIVKFDNIYSARLIIATDRDGEVSYWNPEGFVCKPEKLIGSSYIYKNGCVIDSVTVLDSSSHHPKYFEVVFHDKFKREKERLTSSQIVALYASLFPEEDSPAITTHNPASQLEKQVLSWNSLAQAKPA